jgi:hypothetical protein
MAEAIGEWLTHVALPGAGTVLFIAGVALAKKYIDRIDNELVREVLRELVRAAEQIYGAERGTEKRKYVERHLRERGLDRRVGRAEIEAMVNTEFPKFEVAPEAEGPGGPPPEFTAEGGFDADGE